MPRLNFLSASVRKSFFNKVLLSFHYKTWQELANYLRIRRTQLEKYRNGSLTMSSESYLTLTSELSDKDRAYFSRNIRSLDDNWGRIKGGVIAHSNNPSILTNGRSKAILAIQQKTNTFDIGLPLNADLAYILGLFIGDGFSNKYGRHYLTQFVGNKKEELSFYREEILPIVYRLFGISARIIEFESGNYIRVNLYSKALYRLWSERFKIRPGKKSYTVLIPDEVVNADRNILMNCIAGIYDAESCVFLDRRKTYAKPYPRIDLHMINPSILTQISELLAKEGIVSSFTNNNTHLLIYGDRPFRNFLSKIPLRSPKNLRRIESYLRLS